MFEATLKWLNENPKSSGRVLDEVCYFALERHMLMFQIRFTNFDDETVYLMKKEFHARFGGGEGDTEQPENTDKPVNASEPPAKADKPTEVPPTFLTAPPVQKEPEVEDKVWEEDNEVELVDLDDEDTLETN